MLATLLFLLRRPLVYGATAPEHGRLHCCFSALRRRATGLAWRDPVMLVFVLDQGCAIFRWFGWLCLPVITWPGRRCSALFAGPAYQGRGLLHLIAWLHCSARTWVVHSLLLWVLVPTMIHWKSCWVRLPRTEVRRLYCPFISSARWLPIESWVWRLHTP